MVYIPTTARTEAGFYLDIEPVEVASAGDIDGVRSALTNAIRRGNPSVPTPTRAAFPKPIVLKYSKARSWSEFEKGADVWSIKRDADRYQLIPGKRRHDRGWEEDYANAEPQSYYRTIGEIVERVVLLVQRASEISSATPTKRLI